MIIILTQIKQTYSGRFELENIDPILYELISRMIQPNAVDRITIEGVLKHPAFWEKDKILRFLSETSDRLEREETDSEILNSIEQFKEEVGGEDWKLRLAESKFQVGTSNFTQNPNFYPFFSTSKRFEKISNV